MMHIRVRVTFDSARQKVNKIAPDMWDIFVREPALKNLANKAVVRVVAEELGVPPSFVRMVAGHRRRNKALEIYE